MALEAAETRVRVAVYMLLLLAAAFAAFNPVGFLGLGASPDCVAAALAALALFYAVVRPRGEAKPAALSAPGAAETDAGAALRGKAGGARITSAAGSTPSLVLWLRVTFFLVMAVSAGLFFGGSNVLNRARFKQLGNGMLFDVPLLAVDSLLLGWAFPRGQLALWLDSSTLLGPDTPLGRLLTEVLQVCYASYYFWGYALGVFCTYEYVMSAKGRLRESALTTQQHWRRVLIFTTAWTGTYMFNFALNLLFPAVSPRIYLEFEYLTPIRGLFFADLIRGAIAKAAARSFSAFPSGHCGISWLAAFLAYRFGYHRYAKIVAVVSGFIVAATLVLRYHYFADALFAPLLPLFGAIVSQTLRQRDYEAVLRGADSAASDATGRV
jgi:hypothetical protein